jgi:hypothetical protein
MTTADLLSASNNKRTVTVDASILVELLNKVYRFAHEVEMGRVGTDQPARVKILVQEVIENVK